MNHRRSNEDAVISLFNLYEQKMYHIAFSILHDSYLAEDAVMNAFMRMLERQYAVDDPKSEEAKHLVIRVIRSAAIDLYRKNKSEQERLCLTEDPASLVSSRSVDTPSDDTSQIESMIGDLPPIYRNVLHYRYIKDCSVSETAAALGISPESVRKRQERALRKLRDKKSKNRRSVS